MAKSTFSEAWLPTNSHEVAYAPKVTHVTFGDGYEARFSSGMNITPEVWSLRFEYNVAVADQILAFIKDHNAIRSFYWKNPNGEVISVVCRKWSSNKDRGIKTITANFDQVFEA